MIKYNVGDVIRYQPFGGGWRDVLVDEKDDDIKNGRSGFGGRIVSGPDTGMGVWGYDYQIVKVLT